MKDSLKEQIGGTHYKAIPYQPIEYIAKLRLNFVQGCIAKYVARYKNKNGKQDLLKCVHYAQLGFDLGVENFCWFDKLVPETTEFINKNHFNGLIGDILLAVGEQDWVRVIAKLRELINKEYGDN